MKIMITGAGGFVGKHLVNYLIQNEFEVVGVTSNTAERTENNDFKLYSLNDFISGKVALKNVSSLIHLAGAAHAEFTDKEAKDINVTLTEKVLKKVRDSGIKQFIFLSTANVNGFDCKQSQNSALSKENFVNTVKTKYEAEKKIKANLESTNCNFVIIRSPLIYGEGVKANFASLLNLVNKGFPLPLRNVTHNRRSMVSVYNLVDLIRNCVVNPNANNQTFLVSDDNDLSTAKTIELMSKALGKSDFSLPVPVWFLKWIGKLLKKEEVVDRLTGSFELDITHTKNTLNWKPPYSVDHGFRLATKNFKSK